MPIRLFVSVWFVSCYRLLVIMSNDNSSLRLKHVISVAQFFTIVRLQIGFLMSIAKLQAICRKMT